MIDFLIIGGGISGLNIAAQLQQFKQSFRLVDPCNMLSATAISAGIINPVTGRKFATQWNMDEIIPIAEATYLQLEKQLNIKVLHKTQVIKIHKSEAALEEWLNAKSKPTYSNYISEFKPGNLHKFIDFRFGGINISPAFHVDTPTLLSAFYKSLNDQLIVNTCNYDEIKIHDNYFEYEGNNYSNIIFCEGFSALQNPYFNFIPFKPAKGECLIIKIPNFNTTSIIMKGIMLVPLGNELFWVGATNTWDDLTNQTTAQGSDELTSGLQTLLKVPYEIISQKAAIRPTIKDRTPVVGSHPEIKNMFTINGMGTRGTAYAPFYAAQLVNFILMGDDINPTGNINRF